MKKSLKNKVVGFFKTETNAGEQSLEVDIDSSGVKLDITSLLKNDRVTHQMQAALKNIRG